MKNGRTDLIISCCFSSCSVHCNRKPCVGCVSQMKFNIFSFTDDFMNGTNCYHGSPGFHFLRFFSLFISFVFVPLRLFLHNWHLHFEPEHHISRIQKEKTSTMNCAYTRLYNGTNPFHMIEDRTQQRAEKTTPNHVLIYFIFFFS